jgi:hypothetical protein
MESDEHRKLADDLEREADDMQKNSDRVADQASDLREDWERKQKDPGVPGAEGRPESGE